MKAKVIIIAVALFVISTYAAQAQTDIPIVQADTVFQGFEKGRISGLVFGPTGETVIVMHDAQPVEIDIKTHQIVREFEKVPNNIGTGNSPIMIKSKNYFTAYVTSTELLGIKGFGGNVIWDYNTGKIVKALQDVFLLSDGSKFYSRCYSDNYTKEYIGLYDINTFKYIDSIYFDNPKVQGTQVKTLQCFNIIPNSNKVIIGVNNKYPDGGAQRSKLYVLDFDTKQYTEIPIPYELGQDSSLIYSIKASNNATYIVVTMRLPKDQTACFFYDKDFKFIFKETGKHLLEQNANENGDLGMSPNFVNDNFLLFWVAEYNKSTDIYYYYTDFYSIVDRAIKKRILFGEGEFIDCFDNKIVIGKSSGIVGLLHFDALPVQDNQINPIEKTAEYQNGILTIYSETAENADIEIIDYRGNMIFSKKDILLQEGKNLLNIDYPLINGVYFTIVKFTQKELSYKFIVAR